MLEAYEGGDAVALATVVNVPEGATNLGAKLLLRLDGSVAGSLGSSQLDEKATAVGEQVAQVGAVESFTTDEGTEVFVEGFHYSAYPGNGGRRARGQGHRRPGP